MNTNELDIKTLQGKILAVETNIPLLRHRSDNNKEVFRVIPSLEVGLMFCGGKKKSLIAFPTRNLKDKLKEVEYGDNLFKSLTPGMEVKVIHTSEKSIVIDYYERSGK